MRSVRNLRGLLVVVAFACLLIGAAGAEAKKKDARGCLPGQPAGAPGIGDEYYPTYGNGGYDVRRYELRVAYDPATDVLNGKATIPATATQSVCSFNLDLVGLEVTKVTVDDRKAAWSREGQELTVTPKTPLERGKRFEVFVRYSGVPVEFVIPGTPIRAGFMDVADGVTVAGQPEVAASWYPVNDHPLDKAAYRFEVTVPSGYEVAANGFLRDTDTGGGRTTWEWVANQPMASYLSTIDVGFWDVTETTTDAGLPVYDAVDSALTGELRAAIDSSLGRQGEVLDLLDDSFGPYPFNTVGAIVESQDDLRFALETQTRPVYSKLFWLDREGNVENGDGVVVHELAHQWFGDDVALARWQDIWLNEGFASYAEWLWAEHEGQGTPAQIFRATYEAIPEDDPFWDLPIGDPGVEMLFNDPVYVRGAMTVQALREEVGDAAFFEILREWTSSKGGGNGTTPQFIALAEEVSGMQLDDFFDTWLFTGERPALEEPAAATQAQADAASGYSSTWLDEVGERLALGRY